MQTKAHKQTNPQQCMGINNSKGRELLIFFLNTQVWNRTTSCLIPSEGMVLRPWFPSLYLHYLSSYQPPSPPSTPLDTESPLASLTQISTHARTTGHISSVFGCQQHQVFASVKVVLWVHMPAGCWAVFSEALVEIQKQKCQDTTSNQVRSTVLVNNSALRWLLVQQYYSWHCMPCQDSTLTYL